MTVISHSEFGCSHIRYGCSLMVVGEPLINIGYSCVHSGCLCAGVTNFVLYLCWLRKIYGIEVISFDVWLFYSGDFVFDVDVGESTHTVVVCVHTAVVCIVGGNPY